MMLLSREDIVRAARAYIGTPFVHGARMRGQGIDCVGLLECVSWDLGMAHAAVPAYQRSPDPALFRRLLSERMDQIPIVKARDGDVVSLRWHVEQHVAILASMPDGRRTLIHAYSHVGKCVEHGYVPPWTQRVCAAWRFKAELL